MKVPGYYPAREFYSPRYGAPVLRGVPTAPLAAIGLEPDRFHLAVARFEPENHVLESVEKVDDDLADLGGREGFVD